MAAAIRPPIWARLPGLGNLGYPIALKEMRAVLRRNRFLWAQFVYLSVIAVGVVLVIAALSGSQYSPEAISRNIFRAFFVIQHFLVLLIFPAFGATAISGERLEKSFDLLQTTELRPAEIVWGKFLGIFGNCCYFLLVSFPLVAVCKLFGGVGTLQALENFSTLGVEAAVLTIFGIMVSAISGNNLRSVLITYAIVILLAIGSAPVMAFFLSQSEISWLRMLPAGGEREGTILSASFGVVLCFAICFTIAVQRLTSPEGNRVTPLRVLVLVALIGAMGFGMFLQHRLQVWGELTAMDDIAVFSTLIVTSLAWVLWAVAVGCSGGRVETPVRVVHQVKRRPWVGVVFWPLLPGGVRGLTYSMLLLLLWLGGVWWMVIARGFPSVLSQSESKQVLAVFLVSWQLTAACILAYAALAFMIAATGVRGMLNWALVFGIAVLANLYALRGVVQETSRGMRPTLYPPSLLVSLMQYADVTSRKAFGDDPTLPLRAAFYFHIVAAGILFVIGLVILRKRGIPAWRYGRPRVSTASA